MEYLMPVLTPPQSENIVQPPNQGVSSILFPLFWLCCGMHCGCSGSPKNKVPPMNPLLFHAFYSDKKKLNNNGSYHLQRLEFDREGLTKLKKAVKAIHNSGNSKLQLRIKPQIC